MRRAHFSDGLAVVRIGDYFTGKSGYIDRTGTIVITPQFDAAGSFSEGLAEVRVGDWKTGKYGYIDKTGAMVIAPQFSGAAPFSEGLAAVLVGNEKTGHQYGFIDRRGQMVIAPRFEGVGPSAHCCRLSTKGSRRFSSGTTRRAGTDSSTHTARWSSPRTSM